jgi:peptidoglycan/xylan/chitin deacetylase (PgdA/CDA1 family)
LANERQLNHRNVKLVPNNESVGALRDGSGIWGLKSMRMSIVTTSWDDGDQLDLKLAELLRSKGIRGTLYVPIQPFRRQALSHPELRELSSQGFEIGAHGFSHKLLKGLSAEELAAEINPCKPALEHILGTEVRMFCYPRGRYDSDAVRAVKEAGYSGARTLRMLATRPVFDAFEMPTTVQVYPHSSYGYFKNVAKAGKMEGLQLCVSHRSRLANWLELAKKLFDSVLQNGGIWHLYGHSWEIEQLGLWKELSELLDYVGERKNVTYVPNGGLVGEVAVQTVKVQEECTLL